MWMVKTDRATQLTSRSVTSVDRVNTLIQENRRITVSAVADVLDVSYGSGLFHNAWWAEIP
jgi:hypothetical protein